MSHLRLTLLLCTAEILGLSGLAAFPALLPLFLKTWNLTHTQAGWLNAVYYGAYVLAVPVLTILTDRRDARSILLFGLFVGAVSSIGYAADADGFTSALFWRFLAGISLAGIYMPGLKLLSDHTEGPKQSRYISFYTASFSLGTSLSYLMAGEIEPIFGWRWAFGVAGILAAGGAIGVVLFAPRGKIVDDEAPVPFQAGILTVLRRRQVMAYILGYAAHMWELFSMRSWIVAFLFFSGQLQKTATLFPSPTQVAALINLIGLPASIGGNELCRRYGRKKILTVVMLSSALLSIAVGFSAPLPYAFVVILTLIYGAAVLGDSASLTAGAVAQSPPGGRGATLAVHSTIGFGAAFIGPLAVGMILDLFHGSPAVGWGIAFTVMGTGCALGPLAIAVLGKERS